MTFSDTEHLIALTGMPNYLIQIWLWRSGTLKISISTNIIVDEQILRISQTQPLTICQLSRRTPHMFLYEVHGALESWYAIDRRVKMHDFKESDGLFHGDFTNEGVMTFITGKGNVYQVSPTSGNVKLIIEWDGGSGNYESLITSYKSGLIISGPNSIIKVCIDFNFKCHVNTCLQRIILLKENVDNICFRLILLDGIFLSFSQTYIHKLK